MKFFRRFDVEIIKFKEGKHDFDFLLENSFFQNFEDNELVREGQLTTRVTMDKGANLIEMSFRIEGSVRLVCDRSLEEFDHALSFTENMIYKYGLEEQEINEDVTMITRDTPVVNVSQLIYEFILLALPLKKIHPDHRNELDDEDYEGDGSYAYVDQSLDNESEENISTGKKEQIDPRWELLKNLKIKE